MIIDNLGGIDKGKVISHLTACLNEGITRNGAYAYAIGYIAAISDFISVREARHIQREVELCFTKIQKQKGIKYTHTENKDQIHTYGELGTRRYLIQGQGQGTDEFHALWIQDFETGEKQSSVIEDDIRNVNFRTLLKVVEGLNREFSSAPDEKQK